MARNASLKNINGLQRVVIRNVQPQLDCGQFAIKRCVGEAITVSADIFADGHDLLSACLLYRHASAADWQKVACIPADNDSWQASFCVEHLGIYFYTLIAWIDEFKTWQHQLEKKLAARLQTPLDFLTGAELIKSASNEASGTDKEQLLAFATAITAQENANAAFDPTLTATMLRYAKPRFISRYDHELSVIVDRAKAGFSAWYELFPRSWSKQPLQHGTFNDVIQQLAYIKELGFDVIYFPPIHPIGQAKRKGKNNSTTAEKTDPGSPWAIGGTGGGHMDINPLLGNKQEFRKLLRAIHEHGMEPALDFALQCSPDHPYLSAHPEWFKQRCDGTLQYAENPPKKYEDIYPLYFETDAWPKLWLECKKMILFWVNEGIKIFRVDNPHTKPFAMWRWLIAEVKREYPEVIFLSEAFTRPKIMYELAKLGFSQSYTYFTWRNTKEELTSYFTELTSQPIIEFFRSNIWPNTPDILHEYLQHGGRPAFITRFILAATLGCNYGIYGPAFELCDNKAVKPGSEEYLNSEKYEIKAWDLNSANSIKQIIAKVNKIRQVHKALHNMHSLQFHHIDNPQLICYSKQCRQSGEMILVVVNLDSFNIQSGWVTMPSVLANSPNQTFQVHDLLQDETYLWNKQRNYVELNPARMPGHILHVIYAQH